MAATTDASASAHLYVKREAQWRPIEFVFWAATLLPFLLFPNYLSLASQIAITALFALSLDLILGYAGIVSLGHAAFFGLGAYTAGILSVHGWGDPLIRACRRRGSAAGILGYATSFIIAHFRHLALIMITLGLGLLLHELANSASWLTGGSDGLQGVSIRPLLGRFSLRPLRLHGLRLLAGRAVPRVPGGAGASSTRRSAWRCGEFARMRCACRRSVRRAPRTSARSTPSPR